MDASDTFASALADAADEALALTTELDNEEIMPEDAHDPQELCAFLATPHA